MSTLRDVAARAGVSVATASRVASGAAAVSPATRARVERAMRDLLYVPPGRRGGTTSAIGLLVPELGNPIFPALAQAMEARATAAGFASILCNTAGSALREADYVHMLLERRVAGMIFISSEITDLRSEHAHYRRLLAEGARMVFVNGSSAALDVTSIGVDERAAGRLATEHLLELGHRRIGFVAGEAWSLPTREKAEGRAGALRHAGIEPDPRLVTYADFTVEGGREAFATLLAELREPPTGVVCSNDLMAIGVLQAASLVGLRVPHDLSVVGFDGVAAEWTQPRLTTIEQPIDEIAETAVSALRALIEEPAVELPNFVFRPRLNEGETTAPPTTAA